MQSTTKHTIRSFAFSTTLLISRPCGGAASAVRETFYVLQVAFFPSASEHLAAVLAQNVPKGYAHASSLRLVGNVRTLASVRAHVRDEVAAL